MIKKGTNSEFRTLVCKGRKRLVFLQPSKLDSGPSGSTEQKCWCLRTITSCLRTIEVAYGPSQVASGPSGCLRTIRLPPDHHRLPPDHQGCLRTIAGCLRTIRLPPDHVRKKISQRRLQVVMSFCRQSQLLSKIFFGIFSRRQVWT